MLRNLGQAHKGAHRLPAVLNDRNKVKAFYWAQAVRIANNLECLGEVVASNRLRFRAVTDGTDFWTPGIKAARIISRAPALFAVDSHLSNICKLLIGARVDKNL